MRPPALFESDRMDLGESIEITVASLRVHTVGHDHWAIAYSGGKDSTTVLTLVLHLIRRGLIDAPKRLTVCYADTRMELPPLAANASAMLARIASEGVEVRIAVAEMDKRFLVYMLGRGIPPPNNSTFRWCTRQIKVEPMQDALRDLAAGSSGKILMLTGVRLGESAARDGRIAMSCGKNGAECGQGWYQESLPGDLCDTLAPILHWRTCLVWDWLAGHMEPEWRHGYPTRLVADAYGLSEEGSPAERDTRTGCNGCPLATVDSALDNLLRSPRWAYLEPLKGLRPIFRRLREPANRLRKPGSERSSSGKVRATNRMGPIVMVARRHALAAILDIQARCNIAAPPGSPSVDMLDPVEVARIIELIDAGTWPQKWDGDEPTGDVPFDRVYSDGTRQVNFLSTIGGDE